MNNKRIQRMLREVQHFDWRGVVLFGLGLLAIVVIAAVLT